METNYQSSLKRKEQPGNKEKPLFLITHESLKQRINEFHRVEFLQTILFNHNAIKLKISNKIKNHKTLSMINF